MFKAIIDGMQQGNFSFLILVTAGVQIVIMGGKSNVTIDFTQIIIALIGVCSAIITGYLIPFIKAKAGAQKWEQMQKIVQTAVAAAEQLGITGHVTDKFEYAKAKAIEEMGKRGISFDCDTIENAIEAMVLNLKSNVGGTSLKAAPDGID